MLVVAHEVIVEQVAERVLVLVEHARERRDGELAPLQRGDPECPQRDVEPLRGGFGAERRERAPQLLGGVVGHRCVPGLDDPQQAALGELGDDPRVKAGGRDRRHDHQRMRAQQRRERAQQEVVAPAEGRHTEVEVGEGEDGGLRTQPLVERRDQRVRVRVRLLTRHERAASPRLVEPTGHQLRAGRVDPPDGRLGFEQQHDAAAVARGGGDRVLDRAEDVWSERVHARSMMDRDERQLRRVGEGEVARPPSRSPWSTMRARRPVRGFRSGSHCSSRRPLRNRRSFASGGVGVPARRPKAKGAEPRGGRRQPGTGGSPLPLPPPARS